MHFVQLGTQENAFRRLFPRNFYAMGTIRKAKLKLKTISEYPKGNWRMN